jgi:nicotinamidase-related amidase
MSTSTSKIIELNPKTTATLVLDVELMIIGMVPGSEACLPIILRLIDAGNKAGCTAAYVRVGFKEEEWAKIGSNTKFFYAMKQRFGDALPAMINADSESTALHPEIQKRFRQDQDIEVRKTRFGVFTTTDLHQQLVARKIDTLIIAGIKTSGAVLSAVRFAADYDYKIVIVKEGVVDPNIKSHDILMENIFPEQGHVVSITDVEKALHCA